MISALYPYIPARWSVPYFAAVGLMIFLFFAWPLCRAIVRGITVASDPALRTTLLPAQACFRRVFWRSLRWWVWVWLGALVAQVTAVHLLFESSGVYGYHLRGVLGIQAPLWEIAVALYIAAMALVLAPRSQNPHALAVFTTAAALACFAVVGTLATFGLEARLSFYLFFFVASGFVTVSNLVLSALAFWIVRNRVRRHGEAWFMPAEG